MIIARKKRRLALLVEERDKTLMSDNSPPPAHAPAAQLFRRVASEQRATVHPVRALLEIFFFLSPDAEE